MAKKNPEEQATFESAMERLEQLVERMEGDKLPLEELLVRYEEGVKLVKFCSERLEAAQKRIEIIARGAGGEATLEEFEPGTERRPGRPSEDAGENVSLF